LARILHEAVVPAVPGGDPLQDLLGRPLVERDGVDPTAALFSESQGRMLISVGREDDVKFVGLCEARNIPVLRIGVTDTSEELVIQDVASWALKDLGFSHARALPELFA